MAYTPKFGTKKRDYLYSREKAAAHFAGRGEFPICPHCDQPVTPGQAWDEAHITIPKAFGGKSTGVGHRTCNQLDNHQNVTPAFAKAEAARKKHVGIKGVGLGKSPMRGGRRSRESKTMRHGVRGRLTHAEKHALFLKRRYFVEVPDVDGGLEVFP